jgi:hypothetical protein
VETIGPGETTSSEDVAEQCDFEFQHTGALSQFSATLKTESSNLLRTSKQTRCYNCCECGHIARYCLKKPEEVAQKQVTYEARKHRKALCQHQQKAAAEVQREIKEQVKEITELYQVPYEEVTPTTDGVDNTDPIPLSAR